jgi:hypothetical protein
MIRKIASVCTVGAAVSLIGFGSAQAQFVTIGNASGAAGSTVEVVVSFTGEGSGASAANIEMGNPATTPINVRENGNPDCAVNPDINKGNSSFRFRPRNCTTGTDCDTVLIAIISLDEEFNGVPIPDGPIATCNFTIPGAASPGISFDFPVNLAEAIFAGPPATSEDVTAASSGGVVNVVDVPTATSTPDVPTPTNTPTRTNTPRATDTAVATATRSGGGGDDDDGCQVVAPANSSAGWLLLIPAAALLWQRRRSR